MPTLRVLLVESALSTLLVHRPDSDQFGTIRNGFITILKSLIQCSQSQEYRQITDQDLTPMLSFELWRDSQTQCLQPGLAGMLDLPPGELKYEVQGVRENHRTREVPYRRRRYLLTHWHIHCTIQIHISIVLFTNGRSQGICPHSKMYRASKSYDRYME